MKYRYKFKGIVLVFDKIVANNYTAETVAVSEEKALSNFAYQYKKKNNLAKTARVTLKGTVTEIETII